MRRYALHEENKPHDKRIDEEVAPGFPGSLPRTTSNTSQLLLGTDKARSGERLALYEVNPIYDSANGRYTLQGHIKPCCHNLATQLFFLAYST